MALHKLASATIGVPNVGETAAYYRDFGLVPTRAGWFSTADGGEQLQIVRTPTRRLVGFTVGVDDEDDLNRVASRLRQLDVEHRRQGMWVISADPVTGVVVTVRVLERMRQQERPPTPYNEPGRNDRPGIRAPVTMRDQPVLPRKLGHVVLGTTDFAVSQNYFVDGVGFRVSDLVKDAGAFMRCSTEHHNLLLLRAPVNFLHHTGWQVDDVDEIGRGATAMLDEHPERHVWGLGRHHVGSNFFWYLKDPAGNFTEYYSDTDCIIEDELWTPEEFDGAHAFFNWGTPPPSSFLRPEDLAALMMGADRV
ncbi:MAG: VOC family protein [Pseudonocardiaceae bacterium]